MDVKHWIDRKNQQRIHQMTMRYFHYAHYRSENRFFVLVGYLQKKLSLTQLYSTFVEFYKPDI